MRRIVAILVVLAACGAAVVLTGATTGTGTPAAGKNYKIIFDNAFGLTEGGDLRIGGVQAGKTPKFDVASGEPSRAIVYANISRKGFNSLREDATCEIRQQSLIGEYYVDCQPGRSPKEIPDNGTIPVEQTASTIPIDLIQNIQRRPTRERLRLIIAELGAGLAGRPEDLAETLRRAHPGLRETSKTLRILADQDKIIQRFIEDSDEVVGELEEKKTEVSRFVKEAGETAEITASRKSAFQQQFRELPTFLRELEPTMQELGQFTDAQVPLLRNLQSAAPSLRRFFEELGPFSQASRPSFRSLGDTSVVGRRAFRESSEEIRALRAVARNAPGTARPLRQLLQSLDKRSRSIEPDPRAASTSPGGRDRSAYRKGEGFTGFESFWNYFYWQTLTINAFDDVSHFLRILGIESEECGAYQADPSAKERRDCSSYLGPYQPGITAPDPTAGNDPTDGSRSSSAATRGRGAPKRGAPEQDALPGQPDFSDPDRGTGAGAAVGELMKQIGKQGKTAPPADSSQDERLLDFLMAP